jgi:O-antigen ligase
MLLLKYNERIHIFLIGAIAFLLPAYPRILAPVIVLLAVNWLCAPKLVVSGFKIFLNNISLVLLVLFYLLYIAGMLYSNNIKVGLETIETKLSFLIFPLVFSSYAETSKNNLNKYLKLFIYGSVANAVICFAWAAYRYIKPVYEIIDGIPYDLGPNYFYYTELSIFMHPSYIALYCVFALIAIIYLLNIGETKLNWRLGGAIFLLIIYVLLLSSKAGWIGLFIFVLYFFRSLARKKRIMPALIMIGCLIALFFVFNIYFTPSYSNRITELSVITTALNSNSNEDNKKDETKIDGSKSRILVWKSAAEIIKDNFWIGVGTGDAKDKMLEKYKEKGMTTEYESKLNSHNQFLNTFVALGVIGFSLLFLCFLVPLYFSFRTRKVLIAAFMIIVGLNFLFESMLETQAGVIFYAFFYSLLCIGFLQVGQVKNKMDSGNINISQ